ncbi:MAG: pantoate--beta-alanine ligase [Bacteroidetes bacterium]|jgi:pantoate--beta-alanine ligase|nr:pantoate--beta-alanine ligase [Bacteroidota bacterium]
MQQLTTIRAARETSRKSRAANRRIALVPTMGALHEGHLALVEQAGREADVVMVSIFVNPTQFGPDEDYEAYPRTLQADEETLRRQGVATHVFAPTVQEMYPDGPAAQRTTVVVDQLTDTLCGAYRSGHFDGVTTVVSMLLHIAQPHVAVFGQKDAQQLAVIRRMVRDLHLPVDIVAVPTVREADGLARSSRNAYLNPEERAQAPVLYEALTAAAEAIQAGELQVRPLVRRIHARVADAPLAEPQYIEVVDADDLSPVDDLQPGQRILLALAVYFGDTRLIDNIPVTVPSRT